jgi:hypothetical protein
MIEEKGYQAFYMPLHWYTHLGIEYLPYVSVETPNADEPPALKQGGSSMKEAKNGSSVISEGSSESP